MFSRASNGYPNYYSYYKKFIYFASLQESNDRTQLTVVNTETSLETIFPTLQNVQYYL